MATNYLTPNMFLVVPIPNQEPGPDWATDLNASLTILDQHSHAPGSGVLITPTAININADLPFNNANNVTGLRSVRFFPQTIALSDPTDLGCIYEAGVDLYYNDGNGNQIRITQSGSVAGAAGTITGLPSGTASASYQSGSGTFQFQQATSTAANIDVASVIIRYPGSYPTPSGNAIVLEAPSSLASSYQIVLPSLPSQTNVMTLSAAGIISSVTYDFIGQSMTSVGADAIGTSMSSNGANSVAASRTRATGSAVVGVGGVAISASSGSFSTSSLSFVAVTNQAVQVTTTGNPVFFGFIPDGGTVLSNIQTSNNIAQFQIRRNTSTVIATIEVGTNQTSGGGHCSTAPSAISGLDFPSAGAQNYQVFALMFSGGGSVIVNNVGLTAYEL